MRESLTPTDLNANVETDEALMRRYLSGDPASFEEIYRRHAAKVFAYLQKKLSRRTDVEELHQAVFMKFHRVRRRYDARYPLPQWLFVIARTTLIDFYRKDGRRVPEAEDVTLENISETMADTVADVSPSEMSQPPDYAALEGLTPAQRQIVEMKFVDDLSYEEIAQRLGKTSESLRQIVSRAIRKLRRLGIQKGKQA